MKLFLTFAICAVAFAQVFGATIKTLDNVAPVEEQTKVEEAPVKPRAEIVILDEYQTEFNRLHFEMNYQLRIGRDAQSARIKVLAAQFISRLGFATTEIRDEQDRTYNMILSRALEIGNLNNPCIIEKNDELAEFARIAGYEIASDAHLADTELAALTTENFYPLARVEQMTATGLQSNVIGKLSRANAVTRFPEVATDLAFQFLDAELGFAFFLNQIEQEVGLFQTAANEIRGHVFDRIDNIIRNFHILTTEIVNSLNECV